MSTHASTGRRLPTTGPESERYERYRTAVTPRETVLVYDERDEERWLEAEAVLTLEDWR